MSIKNARPYKPDYTHWLRCHVCANCEFTYAYPVDLCICCGGEDFIRAIGKFDRNYVKGHYFPIYRGRKDLWLFKKKDVENENHT